MITETRSFIYRANQLNLGATSMEFIRRIVWGWMMTEKDWDKNKHKLACEQDKQLN